MPSAGFYTRFAPPSKRAIDPSDTKSPTSKRDRDASSPVTSPSASKKQKANPTFDSSPKPVGKKDKNKVGQVKQPSVVNESTVQQTKDRNKSDVVENGGKDGPESIGYITHSLSAEEGKTPKADYPQLAPGPVQAPADLKKKKSKRGDSEPQADLLDGEVNGANDSKKRKRKREQQEENEGTEDAHSQSITKHSKIRSKFEKSTIQAKAIKEDGSKGENTTRPDEDTKDIGEPVFAHGLEPLPQPAPAPDTGEKPTYSSLPDWLANPVKASVDKRTSFADLGIDDKLVNILSAYGYEQAFAVQSTVIPLLLPTPSSHPGDLCISAATGSGKTLAYVLPMVKALESTPAPVLRGLIVVPTRELVKQAREACELCAAGSGLRIGSAVGNVALKDEQRTLMRVDSVYDPDSFKAREEQTMTAKDWTEFSLNDYITEVETADELLYGYVNRPEPNVDILICTPGRLVDHIRATKGFTLRQIQWLVVDEADRLLNESFQEWVEVVMKSLDERNSSQEGASASKLLAAINLPLEKREPKKVVLSATLTTDISKLNSLRLTNPKLVVIGAPEAENKEDGLDIQDAETKFTLPATLREFSVSVGDGSEKPLQLLHLLLNHIKIETGVKNDGKNNADSEASSETDESSSASSDDEQSASDSESDSESSSSDGDSSDSSSDDESESVSSDDDPKAKLNTVLVFTKSSEAAARLSRLLCLMYPSLSDRIGTIIKSNKSSASRKTLRAYRTGTVSVIVATDRAARGLDLPSLTHVVNYDMPPSVTTYVHRVGRTARAGRDGSAWTLVAHREGRWFSNEIVKGSEGKIVREDAVEKVTLKMETDKERLQAMKRDYEAALEELANEVSRDGKNGKVKK